MNTTADFSIGDWIENTLNYQNEDVFILYAIVFFLSLIVCVITYKKACSTQHKIDGGG